MKIPTSFRNIGVRAGAVFLLLPFLALSQTWTPVATGLSTTLYTVYFVNASTGWFGGDGSVIRKSTDGGATWTAQSGNRNITSIQFINPNTGWAVGGSGGTGTILRTTNGGTTWTVVTNSGIPVLWNVQFLDSLRGWAVGASGSVYKTTNGGLNWTAQTSGTTVDFRDHHFVDTSTGWAVGFSGTIRKTVDGGTTWTAQTSGTTNQLSDVFFVNADTGWCVGVGGVILKTVNGGATWVPQTSGTTSELASLQFLNATTGYASGVGGVLLKTLDGGTTWVPLNSGTTGMIHTIHMLNEATGWMTTSAGGFLRTVAAYPSNLSYPANPATFSVGIAGTTGAPSISGSPSVYSVVPDLPAGLSLNATTGVISGTPLATAPSTAYVITATNDYGSTAAILNIAVHAPPSGLTYPNMSALYAVGSAITPNTPSVTGHVASYSVSPSLPAGLTLNATTGVISGTPSSPASSTNYTVTANNGGGGTTSTTLEITVLLKPTGLIYTQNTASYPVNAPITPNAPSLQGSAPISYSVAPPLPSGLSLNAQTGIITGTPAFVAAATTYTITATNAVGSTTRPIVIVVHDPSPIRAPADPTRRFGLRVGASSRIELRVPTGVSDIQMEILDARGRSVWKKDSRVDADIAWDGRHADGQRVAAGIYSVRATWRDAFGKLAGSESRIFALLP